MSAEMLSQPAARMADIARRDLQFDVPAEPRLCQGLVVAPLASGLLLEGAPQRQVLEGAAARNLLPRLLPLLDGTRSHALLAQAMDIPEAAVFQAVALLYSCGVLEHGDGALSGDDDVAAFLSRSADSTRLNRSGRAARRRLEEAVVSIEGGEPRLVALVTGLLRASGVGTVRTREKAARADATLVVAVVTTGADQAALASVVWRAGAIPVLRIRVSDTRVEIGPLFARGLASCPSCLTACQAGDPVGRPSDLYLHLAASLAAGEIVHLLARLGPTPSLYGVAALHFEGCVYDTLAVPQVLGCSWCEAPPAPPDRTEPTSLPLTYERMMAFPPREFLSLKSHQRHYLPSNARLQHDTHAFPNTARHALSNADPLVPVGDTTLSQALDGRAPSPVSTSDVEALSALLRLSFGLRTASASTGVERWVASGANMGSPQCYLAVGEGVAGLTGGVYAYDITGHSLRSLAADPKDVFSAVGAEPGPGRPAAAVIVMTGAQERLVRKYESLAYRILLLDAGCVLAQLRVVGAAVGIAIEPATRWDDGALALALNTHPDREPITAAAWLAFSPSRGGHA